jgi:putative peptide zinc metalloprotease protein
VSGGMFSDAWHRVANSKPKLQPNAEVERHRYRGDVWFIIRDPFSNTFFRLSPAAYRFVARLNGDRTAEAVWKECLALFPDEAPGQREIVRLLGQLTNANLIQSDLPPDASMLYTRQKKMKQRELRNKWMSFLFIKFPLFDPHPLLGRLLPFFRIFFSPLGVVLWLGVVGVAVVQAVTEWSALSDRTQGLLSPANLFFLYIAGAVAKAWHELGHGLLCRFFGGEVRTLGAMLLIFTPLPYIDASSSWSFPNRWHRILVASGGMIFEFFLAAVALLVWANTSPGALNAIAYNTIIVASITTFLFNINPLLRFDGYYILSDFLGIPNLGQRSLKMVRYYAEKYLFAVRQATDPSVSGSEAAWLTTYGIASSIYRVFLMYSIAILLIGNFFGIGILIAVIVIVLWGLVPIGKFIHYLYEEPTLGPTRTRSKLISFGSGGLILAFLALAPMPEHFRAQGIVEARNYSSVFTETEGTLATVVARPGSRVKKGDILLELNNSSFEYDLAMAETKIKTGMIRLQEVTYQEQARLGAVQSEIRAARDMRDTYLRFKERLVLRAPMDGIWTAPGLTTQVGTWIPRGTSVGKIVDPSSFNFVGIVGQEDVSFLFDRQLESGSVRLHGQAGQNLPAARFILIPGEQQQLPSPVLSWKHGGEIKTKDDDPYGITAEKPFFLMSGKVEGEGSEGLMHHRRGILRVHVGYDPLLWQWIRRLRQILEERMK